MENSFVKREQRFETENLKQLQVTVKPTKSANEKEYLAEVIDVSRKGMKFRLPVCVPFGETVAIRLEGSESDLKYEGVGTARHMRSISKSSWEIGCSLEPNLTSSLMEFIVAQTGKEQRQYPRFDVEQDVKLQREGDMEQAPACIVNISTGGFCLAVLNSHEVDDRVKIEVADTSGNTKIVPGRVRWQSKAENGYFVGCSFVETNSHLELLKCINENKEKTSTEQRLSWLVVAATMLAILLPLGFWLLMPSGQPAVAQAIPAEQSEEVQPKIEQPSVDLVPDETISTEAIFAEVETTKVAEVAEGEDSEKSSEPSPKIQSVLIRVEDPPAANGNAGVSDPKETVPTVAVPEIEEAVELKAVPSEVESASASIEKQNVDEIESSEPLVSEPNSSDKANAEPEAEEVEEVEEVEIIEVAEENSVSEEVDSATDTQSELAGQKTAPAEPESEANTESKKKTANPNLRTWTDSSGDEQFEAELVEADGSLVVLRNADGKLLTRPYGWFSREDLLFLAKHSR